MLDARCIARAARMPCARHVHAMCSMYVRMRWAHLVLDRDHAIVAAVRESVDRPAEELVGHVHAQVTALHHEAHLVALAVHEQYLRRWRRPLALSLERLWDVRLVQHMHSGRAAGGVRNGRSAKMWHEQRCVGGDEGQHATP